MQRLYINVFSLVLNLLMQMLTISECSWPKISAILSCEKKKEMKADDVASNLN